MKFHLLLARLALATILAAPAVASATGLTFDSNSSGRSGFTHTISGSTVSITADHVCNHGGFSQTVYLQVWYTTQPGPAGSGYVGATFNMGQLSNGFCMTGISGSQPLTPPPNGTYYVHLLVLDSPSGDFDDALTASTQRTFSGGGGGGSTALQNGVALTGLSGAAGSQRVFYLDVPSGASNLRFTTSGGTGDADLFVRYGSTPSPSGTNDCTSTGGSNSESCSVPATAGRWYALVYGYAAYSGVSIVGQYTPSGGGGGTNDLTFDGTVSYDRTGGQVRMQASAICNNTSSTSGTLHWRMRFTTQSTPVGSGFNAAEVQLNPLSGGFCYQNLDRTVAFTQPPAGTYYVHFTLYEAPATSEIVDYVTFSNTVTYADDPGSGDDDEGGGGGAVNWSAMLLLAIAARIRRRPALAPDSLRPQAMSRRADGPARYDQGSGRMWNDGNGVAFVAGAVLAVAIVFTVVAAMLLR